MSYRAALDGFTAPANDNPKLRRERQWFEPPDIDYDFPEWPLADLAKPTAGLLLLPENPA